MILYVAKAWIVRNHLSLDVLATPLPSQPVSESVTCRASPPIAPLRSLHPTLQRMHDEGSDSGLPSFAALTCDIFFAFGI